MKFLVCSLLLCFAYKIKGKAVTKDDLFEGDILLTNANRYVVNGGDKHTSSVGKWPNGVVPYIFERSFDTDRRMVVLEAIQEFHRRTCIKFVPKSVQQRYVRFIIGQGCWSMIGMQPSPQDISIGYGCKTKGIIMHQMMHAVGFWHEQSRLDRDNYVTIIWRNISPRAMYNFRKYPHGQTDYHGKPYNYNSLMHYSNTEFSMNGRPTIVVKGNPHRRLGQRRVLSYMDIDQLNKLYECKGKLTPEANQRPNPGSCSDGSKYCALWAKASEGYCVKYRAYMSTKCKKSCGLCTGKRDGKRTGQGKITGTGNRRGSCSDMKSSCASWARIGECERTPGYMLVYCKRSCGLCGSTRGGERGIWRGMCTDRYYSCRSWQKSGMCTKEARYMNEYCKKSCKRC